MDASKIFINIDFFKIIGFIFSFVSIIIAVYKFKEDRFNKRVSRYRLARELLENDPGTIINNSLNYFRKHLKSDNIVVSYNLYRSSWIKDNYLSELNLLKVKDIDFSIDNIHQRHYKKYCENINLSNRKLGNVFSSFVPYSKLNLVENQLLFFDNTKLWNGRTFGISDIVIGDNGHTKINTKIK